MQKITRHIAAVLAAAVIGTCYAESAKTPAAEAQLHQKSITTDSELYGIWGLITHEEGKGKTVRKLLLAKDHSGREKRSYYDAADKTLYELEQIFDWEYDPEQKTMTQTIHKTLTQKDGQTIKETDEQDKKESAKLELLELQAKNNADTSESSTFFTLKITYGDSRSDLFTKASEEIPESAKPQAQP